MDPVPFILIIDDTLANVIVAGNFLRREGFRVLHAENGPDGRELARKEQPDLILLDLMMPGENGFETCARLKEDPATRRIPVIFVSAVDEVASKVGGLQAGAVDYLPRPYAGEELIARVRAHLRTFSGQQEIVAGQRALLREADAVQQAFRPLPGTVPGAGFAVFSRPRPGSSGDWYDVVARDAGRVGYLAADRRWLREASALFTMTFKSFLRQQISAGLSPADLVRQLDGFCRRVLAPGQYLPACYVEFDPAPGRWTLVGAGYPPPILFGASGAPRALPLGGYPLGAFTAREFPVRTVEAAEAAKILLVSDGLLDSVSHLDTRPDRIAAFLYLCEEMAGLSLAETVQTLGEYFSPPDAPPEDDQQILGMEPGPTAPG